MRQAAAIILLCVVLSLPFAARTLFTPSAPPIAPSTKRLVIITANTQDIRRAFADAFAQWYRQKFHTDVILDYRVPGGGNDILRQLDTTYRAARSADGKLNPNFHADIDMVWGGGDYFFDVELKRQMNVLEPMDIPQELLHQAFPNPTLAGVKLYDYQPPIAGTQRVPEPQWVGLCLSSMGIIYNPDLYHSLQLSPPKTWDDLTNEKLNGLIALADPSHSASVALAYMMVVQRAMANAESQFFAQHPQAKSLDKTSLAKNKDYQSALALGWQTGMQTLQRIAANARYFTAWGSQVPNDVGSGDAAAGIAIDFYGRVYEEQVGANRLQFIAPIGATSTTPDPIAILAGVRGEQYKLANQFIEFLLSPKGQKLWITRAGAPGGPADRSLHRLPIRPDVYADQTNWTDYVNPFEQAHGFNQRNDWMGLFSDTRTVWTAAWIDTRDDLKSAHEAVLNVKDPNRRAALLTDLATLPIQMSDLAATAAERKKLEQDPHSDLEGFAAQKQIELAKKFREHYQEIKRQANNI